MKYLYIQVAALAPLALLLVLEARCAPFVIVELVHYTAHIQTCE